MNIPEEVLTAAQDAYWEGVEEARENGTESVGHYLGLRAALSAAAPTLMAMARQSLIDAIEGELNHAAMNEHELSSRCQGVGPGEHVPAVRISNIEAAIEGATKEQL